MRDLDVLSEALSEVGMTSSKEGNYAAKTGYSRF